MSVYPKSILLPHYVQSIRIDTLKKPRILGYDSHDVHGIIMIKYKNFGWKKIEISGDAIFEQHDYLQS